MQHNNVMPKGNEFNEIRSVLYRTQYYIIMKEQLSIKLNIHLEVSTQKVVKIKAHKRIVNGKTVKVRSHYRVIEG